MTEHREQPIVFECNGERLVGIVHGVDPSQARVGVLVVVGGPQYRAGSHRQFVLMARDFAQAGYPAFRFDYRGMGDSDGASRSFESVGDDIRSAIDTFFTSAPQLQGVVLWGLCDAASACLMYASADERVRAVIIVNPWVHTEQGAANSYVKHYYGQRLLQRSFWVKAARGQLNLVASLGDFGRKLVRAVFGDRSVVQSPGFFIERMRCGLEAFSGPALILMSQNDLTAQEFRDLYGSNPAWASLVARKNVQIAELEGADHTFSSREALVRATRHCLDWLKANSNLLEAS